MNGHISIFKRAADGTGKQLVSKANLTTYSAGSAIAKMAMHNDNYAVRYIYFEFSDDDVVSPPAPAEEDTIESYRSLSSPFDYLRVPIRAGAVIDTADSDSNYEDNRITFFATTAAAPVSVGGVVGEANGIVFKKTGEAVTDYARIYSVGLVVSNGTEESDILYARANLGSVVSNELGYDFDIHWDLTFTP